MPVCPRREKPEAKPSLMDRLKADKPEHEARQMIPPVPERER